MGFQFNSVGGGTKTRRPIALQMKYNPACTEPRCYLTGENGVENELSLEDLQEHIESENRRLHAEGGFWSKDIMAKIEYKYCPNLTIIDTPGLISAAPTRRNAGLVAAARAVEALVRQKMEQKDYIILCLEDQSDWSNASTRKLVLDVDPDLRRTVLVSTKLDTRIPQFSCAGDVELFIRPPPERISGNVLSGGPFFTSVPSGRVGNVRNAVFRTNDHFREMVTQQENNDVASLEMKLDRKLDTFERAHIGVSQLRQFLEKLLQRRYLENVPTIVPVLEKEHRAADGKLSETMRELDELNAGKLQERGRAFYTAFLSRLPQLMRGSLTAPPARFGETLSDEHVRGGAFIGEQNPTLAALNAATVKVPNADMRLFGGAQYHRALEEFRLVVGNVTCPPVNKEDIVNACGMDEAHDGVNYARTACVIAVAKARELLEPYLHQLGFRLAHIMRRLLPVSMFQLQKDGLFLHGHERFLKRVSTSFHSFVHEMQRVCESKCVEDLQSTTEFVTWSLHSGDKSGLRAVLGGIVTHEMKNGGGGGSRGGKEGGEGDASGLTQSRLVDLVENTLWSRTLADVTADIVQLLVTQIFEGIRDHFVQSAQLKFNCFFLMPLLNDFPHRLRNELEASFAENIDEVFDVAAVRNALEVQARRLESEMTQMTNIQKKFHQVWEHLCEQQQGAAVTPRTPGANAPDHFARSPFTPIVA